MRSLTDARPGKSGLVVILIIAAIGAGGAYAWRAGLIGQLKTKSDPNAGVTTPRSTSGAGQTPPGSASSSTSSAPRAPSSIFDDTGGSSSRGTGIPRDTTPTPRPTPPPTITPTPAVPPLPDIAALEAAARNTERSLAQVRDAAVAKLRSSPTFSTRQAEVDRLEADLKRARASGTPQEKLDASAAWNKARLALDKDYDTILEKDAAYVATKSAAQHAAAALRSARLLMPTKK